MSARPGVSVIVPFAGGASDADELLANLARLDLSDRDELLVVDNSEREVVAGRPAAGGVRVLRADAQRSSYYARNVGAEAATGEWLLFLDADCRPSHDLVGRFFEPAPADQVGALAGEVSGDPGQEALAARYARSRRHLVQEEILERPTYRPMAVTANLLVRRRAFDQLGGFLEGIRSTGDADFSWRLQDAGWRLELRAGAHVEHRHRESLRALARQAARIGAGRAWAARRHAGARLPNPLPGLARAAAGTVVWTLALQFERALFKAIDGVWLAAEAAGFLLANAAPMRLPLPEPRAGRVRVLLLLDEFPGLTETFVLGEALALARAGHAVRVEAVSRPSRPNRRDARGLPAGWLEDDGIARKLADSARLALTHPLRVAADLAARRRWSREERVLPLRSLAPCARRLARGGERHVHVHFAGSAALSAMRLSRLAGVTYSITAHAYDIYKCPANLAEKLRGAAFCAGESEYATRDLRAIAGHGHAGRIHHLPAGVDASRFERRRPYPGGRSVLAVGRLIEKKGFTDLVEAAALLAGRAPLERVTIVGDGPLRAQLDGLVAAHGLGDVVQLPGASEHQAVRDALESADVLAMPCVVAADGDRDSLPNVVYEALAMEVPVVGTEEVGLPEVVRPEWGRLVPPRDPEALAAALEELLALPADRRAEMGRAGRTFVLGERDQAREAERLAELFRAAGA